MKKEAESPQFGNDPFAEFTAWYRQAVASKQEYPDAMTLATVKADGRPAARTVLFKGISGGGLLFYTNYESAKAKEVIARPHAALVFFWPGIYRQVRIEGSVEKVTREQSRAYFSTRPRDSQLGAWASNQSSAVPDVWHVEKRFDEMKNKFKDSAEIPCPEYWGGFKLTPQRFEFWIGNPARLHHRFFFERAGTHWQTGWLAP